LVFVAGQVGWDTDERFQSDDLVEQIRVALENTKAILREGGARPEDVARMTWYVIDKDEYRRRTREIGIVYRETMGRNFPAMTLVEVKSLLEDGAKVEIETTAVVAE
jgi:enamine deaminase RidA (YjgF/YER057c/UK114 family)